MTSVAVHAWNVVTTPELAGHFLVYMQYMHGLRAAGCDVYWLERFDGTGDQILDNKMITTLFNRLGEFGFDGRAIIYRQADPAKPELNLYLSDGISDPVAMIRRTDLLLNFSYFIDRETLAMFKRTALIDIDPGLLQVWTSTGQLAVEPHDIYFTTGETVGTPNALFSDCGIAWNYVPPPVGLDLWPYVRDSASNAFTTVSNWWGHEWVVEGPDDYYDNSKRSAFLSFVELPDRTTQTLELALNLGTNPKATAERKLLEDHGWQVRAARDVAQNPSNYRSYVQQSRGEFSCAKPSCMRLQNAWISDRTLCYLASGRPAVVQDTGPSSFLPSNEGLLRFKTIDEAAAGLEEASSHYERHRRAARDLVEAYFDSRQVATRILDKALGL